MHHVGEGGGAVAGKKKKKKTHILAIAKSQAETSCYQG